MTVATRAEATEDAAIILRATARDLENGRMTLEEVVRSLGVLSRVLTLVCERDK